MCKTMSGYFKKAPLSYVSIRFNTTALPQLLDEQKFKLQQEMLSCDLVVYETSAGKQFEISNEGGKSQEFAVTDVYRHGFMDAKRLNAIVFDETGIEWRTTDYSEYDPFIEGFHQVLTKLMNALSFQAHARVKEIALSYVDMIVPEDGSTLNDYFSGIINMPVPEQFKVGVFSAGSTSISNVIEPNLKIDISLEQLPQKFKKYLPESAMEIDEKFGMNIINPYTLSDIDGSEYALLMTRASRLVDIKLGDLNCVEESKPLHLITKETFYKVINEGFCKEKWSYIEGDR